MERFTNRTRNFRVGDDSSFIDMDNDNADNDDTIDDGELKIKSEVKRRIGVIEESPV